MSTSLEQVSSELLARIDKYQTNQSSGGPTHELGGIARISALLEKLLRLALKDMAAVMGTTADALIARTGGGSVSLGRATGGRLSSTLALVAQEPASARPCVRVLMREVSVPSNRIIRVVEVRNKVIHGSDEPASARIALTRLKCLIEEYRRDAGWEKPGSGDASS